MTFLQAENNGDPVIPVCGGVGAVVCWHDPLPGVLEPGWFHWDDDDLAPPRERGRLTGARLGAMRKPHLDGASRAETAASPHVRGPA